LLQTKTFDGLSSECYPVFDLDFPLALFPIYKEAIFELIDAPVYFYDSTPRAGFDEQKFTMVKYS
tara:strand:- start:27702 stop:27896 length:195 start_codon:yes stop_codon:yes gene_type:complete